MTINARLASMRAHAAAHRVPVMSPANTDFVCQLLAQYRPVRVLEIGTATGVSAAAMALSLLSWGGTLTTIEISVPTHAAAQANFAALGLRNVRCMCGDARVLLRDWKAAGEPLFDAVFIDAQKSQTHVFYQAALSVLGRGGLVIVDDVWRYRHKMAAFYGFLAQQQQAYSLHCVDEQDATMVIRLR